jgi:translation initiation factor 2B subunit I family (IF-2BI)
MRTIEWNDIENCIEMIDQTKIPLKLEKKFCKTIDSLIDAIKSLKIRGRRHWALLGVWASLYPPFNTVEKIEKRCSVP